MAILLALLAGCAPGGEVVVGPDGQRSAWRPIFRGVALLEMVAKAPRPLRVYAIRVDLREPGIRLAVSPPQQPGVNTFLSSTTSAFLAREGCQVAVNASAYAPVVDQEGQPQRNGGLVVCAGRVHAPVVAGQGALLVGRDNRAWIEPEPAELEGVWTAIGGYGMLVREGQIVAGADAVVHPRTAAGLSRDGRFLYLMVIDGRQPNYSEGATRAETAQWLVRLGAWSGLNFDGGGSSALAVAQPDGGPRIVNCPIHRGVPGTERPVATHLGVHAQPLQ